MRTPYERWERDMGFLQAINASVMLGPAEPIDLFVDPGIWLVLWQGMESLMALLAEDLNSGTDLR